MTKHDSGDSRLLFPGLKPTHTVKVQIRFSDYDTFRHVNNNSYMAFFDIGKQDFLSRVLGQGCMPSDLSAAIVNINVDFLAPAVIGEELEVHTAVTAVGHRSFTLYQRVVNPLTDSVKAQATTVLSGFDIATQSAAPLREDLAAALRSLCDNKF